MRWTTRQDSEEFDIPAPDGIEAILEYSMADGEVPKGVTIPADPRVSSGEAWGFTTAGDGQEFVRLTDGTWIVL